MTVELNIKSYDITNGDKVEYGFYSALEVVFRQYLKKLETYFYDEFKLSFDFKFVIKTDVKFKDYLDSLGLPSAIFIFKHYPLMRDSVLKTDNRLINLFLSKEKLFKDGKMAVHNTFSIDKANSQIVKTGIEGLLSLFQDSWDNIHPVECALKRLVSNKIKAKVMDDTESCVVIKVQMSQKQFLSEWEFCLSRYQLDRIVEKHGAKGLLAASGSQEQDKSIKAHLTQLLVNDSNYDIKGVLGSVNLSSRDVIAAFRNKTIIPITNPIMNNAAVYLNRIPILAAEVGQTQGQLSLQIQNKYKTVEKEAQKEQKLFSKISFQSR